MIRGHGHIYAFMSFQTCCHFQFCLSELRFVQVTYYLEACCQTKYVPHLWSSIWYHI